MSKETSSDAPALVPAPDTPVSPAPVSSDAAPVSSAAPDAPVSSTAPSVVPVPAAPVTTAPAAPVSDASDVSPAAAPVPAAPEVPEVPAVPASASSTAPVSDASASSTAPAVPVPEQGFVSSEEVERKAPKLDEKYTVFDLFKIDNNVLITKDYNSFKIIIESFIDSNYRNNINAFIDSLKQDAKRNGPILITNDGIKDIINKLCDNNTNDEQCTAQIKIINDLKISRLSKRYIYACLKQSVVALLSIYQTKITKLSTIDFTFKKYYINVTDTINVYIVGTYILKYVSTPNNTDIPENMLEKISEPPKEYTSIITSQFDEKNKRNSFYKIQLNEIVYDVVVDIGEQLFYLNPNRESVNLVYNGYNAFLEIFDDYETYKFPLERIKELFAKYLELDKKMPEFLLDDKNDLIKILKIRLKQIQEQILKPEIYSVINIEPYKKYIINLEILLRDLESTESTENTEDTEDIDDQDKLKILLEIAHYLSHPDSVHKEIKNNWKKIISFLKDNTDNIPNGYANLFKELEESVNKFHVPNASKEINQTIKDKVKAMVLILGMTKKNVESKQQGGSHELDKQICIAIDDLFDDMRYMYDPVFSIVENSVQSVTRLSRTYVKNNITCAIIPELLRLLHVSNNIINPGVYKIKNASKELVHFIELQQQYIKHDEDYKEFMHLIPKVYLNKKRQKRKYMTQLYILDSNLTIPYKREFVKDHKPEIYEPLRNTFKKNTLYLTYSSKSTPMNVYEVDLEKVNRRDTIVHSLVHNYFNNNETVSLEELVKTDKIYNQAILALSIFISIKEITSM